MTAIFIGGVKGRCLMSFPEGRKDWYNLGFLFMQIVKLIMEIFAKDEDDGSTKKPA